MKIRVPSDRFKEHHKEYKALGLECECVPVDLYGRFIPQGKNDGDFEKMKTEIQEYYGLESY